MIEKRVVDVRLVKYPVNTRAKKILHSRTSTMILARNSRCIIAGSMQYCTTLELDFFSEEKSHDTKFIENGCRNTNNKQDKEITMHIFKA